MSEVVHAPLTIQELSRQTDMAVSTIRSHMDVFQRQGAYEEAGHWLFPYGTRYPFFPRKSELREIEKIYRVILNATNKKLYVDHVTLGLLPEEFDALIGALVKEGYLTPTGVANPYGANAYLCTPEAGKLLRQSRENVLRALAQFAQIAGVVISAHGAGLF